MKGQRGSSLCLTRVTLGAQSPAQPFMPGDPPKAGGRGVKPTFISSAKPVIHPPSPPGYSVFMSALASKALLQLQSRSPVERYAEEPKKQSLVLCGREMPCEMPTVVTDWRFVYTHQWVQN